ncbi:class I SAM-dependent methyltransferase [Vagococcus sp. BWB3-3]|uniref:Class I SAM-dependent methyltransferase n=1 Tax=Vagococcus allomyrinae TaxID=2794353 RepID=A0A940P339_9ENTE|nr:class I SAM-dependent methyltransferase [Vagococcus allomyrinae]MBP1040609.1 class I SAM-dependent methyltransferase [Vagococcus allomyrinae]
MTHNFTDIRQEEAFYHTTHYQNFTIDSLDSWLGYPVKGLVNLGLKLADSAETMSFLDLGCGVGRNAIPIVQASRSATLKIDCVDILPTAIDQFSQYAQDNHLLKSFNFYTSDISEFEFANKAYEYIFSVSTLEHLKNIEQLEKTLTAIKKATKKAGYVYLVINSAVTERLIEQQQEISPFLEINLSTVQMMTLLTSVFNDWTIKHSETKDLSFEIERSIGRTEMTTKAITFIAQKRQ